MSILSPIFLSIALNYTPLTEGINSIKAIITVMSVTVGAPVIAITGLLSGLAVGKKSTAEKPYIEGYIYGAAIVSLVVVVLYLI